MIIEITILSACITVFSAILFIISLASYKKHKNKKLMFVILVFFIFLIKGIMMSLSMFVDELAFLTIHPYFGVLDLIMLLILFVAVVKE